MQHINTILIQNASDAQPYDWVTWREFRGTKKEVEYYGQVKERREDGTLLIEYRRPSTAVVHAAKILKIERHGV